MTRYVIGLDPGTTTGYALWSLGEQRLLECTSMPIHRAMLAILRRVESQPEVMPLVIFEDARQRTWFGHSGPEKWQGAGSIKRDCGLWEEYLDDLAVPYIAQKPMTGATKWTDERFRLVSGWDKRTNEHSRDAGVLVLGMTRQRADVLVETWRRTAHA